MTANPPTPLAVPFRIDHFRFRRQVELEQQLGQSRLLQKLRNVAGPDCAAQAVRADLGGAMRLPTGFLPKLDEAARHFHTLARLSGATELRLVSAARELFTCRAYREGRKFVFAWSGRILESCSVPELVCHFATAAYNALETKMREHTFLLVHEAPLSWSDRLALLEASRLRRYAANCFALACTQDRQLVLREDFRRMAAFNSAGMAVDFSELEEHHLRERDLTTARLVNEGLQEFPCHPLLTTVLERFAASAGYHACLGLPCGTPREQFEAEVLALDRQMHPPLTAVPDDQQAYVQLVIVRATYYVMECFAPVTPARRQMFLDFHRPDAAGPAEQLAARDWEPDQAELDKRFLSLLIESQRVWANVHGAHILGRVVEWTLREHGGIPDLLKVVLREMAEWCRVSRPELEAIANSLQPAAASGQDQSGPPAAA